jgi:hypothetical protein
MKCQFAWGADATGTEQLFWRTVIGSRGVYTSDAARKQSIYAPRFYAFSVTYTVTVRVERIMIGGNLLYIGR